MNAVKPLARTNDTVTLKRTDFDALLRSVEDRADLAAINTHRAHEDRVGWQDARRDYLTSEEARRLLDGESAVRVWREKRGISQRALAEAAEVAASYLAEIEGGKKPGSPNALHRIASVLDVPLEGLTGVRTAEDVLRPVNRAETAARKLASLAAGGAGRDRLVDESRAIVSDWLAIAAGSDARHKLGAALQALTFRLRDISAGWRHQAIALDRNNETQAALQTRSGLDSLQAAIDVLREEYRKR